LLASAAALEGGPAADFSQRGCSVFGYKRPFSGGSREGIGLQALLTSGTIDDSAAADALYNDEQAVELTLRMRPENEGLGEINITVLASVKEVPPNLTCCG
jgi:hypothetical protein